MDIIHYFQINGSIESVFEIISTARGISQWWALEAKGHSELGALLDLNFGPGYQWQAQVTQMMPPNEFELTLIKADPDWMDSTVSFQLTANKNGTNTRFFHRGWKEANDHYHISSYCWAMYLRILKRYIEHGETVPYASRLDI